MFIGDGARVNINIMETTSETPKKRDNLKEYRDKKKLAKVNRNVTCIFCATERILNPEQYQAYFDYWGDEEKIKRNFVCQPCDTKQSENPFAFWVTHHEKTRKLTKGLKAIFEVYRASNKTDIDVKSLQDMTVHLLGEYQITGNNMEFIIENQLPAGVKIRNMPFVGTIELKPYNETKINIII